MSDMPPVVPPKRSKPVVHRRRPPALAGVLHENERIMQVAIIHWGIYWKSVAVFLLSLFLLLTLFNLGVFLFAVSGIMFAVAWLTKYYLLLMLTDTRVVVRYGVLQLETVQMHYSKIESVELSWTPMGRILGYATVMITGTGSRVSAIPFIGNAVAFRAELDRLISVQEDKPIKVEAVNAAGNPVDGTL